jgi:hypothetical protein
VSPGPQRVAEHDRLEVGTKAAVDLMTENLCDPRSGQPQTRAREGAVKVRASLAKTRALRQAGQL